MSDSFPVRGGQRCLLAILVYNGRSFVPDCLRSAARLRQATPNLDVLVLDDCSPEPGWSDELRTICASLHLDCYRSPRNLGIPRNMNLGLLRALDAGYDYVVIANSDLVFPENAVRRMIAVAESDPAIGSVTAWSNNVSVYSLLNPGQSTLVARPDTVDWISEVMAGEFDLAAVDVPTGVGFCMMMPVDVVRKVGLFDPVFGRGYCEEVDWCLRSLALGYRVTLTPAVFVFHSGQGSTEQAGLLRSGDTTVWANERIIDLRYPLYRSQIDSYLASGMQDVLQERASRRVVLDGARLWGYVIDASWLPHGPADPDLVHFTVEPDGRHPLVRAQFIGFEASFPVEAERIVFQLAELVGRPAHRVTAFDRGNVTDLLAREAAGVRLPFHDSIGYPARV